VLLQVLDGRLLLQHQLLAPTQHLLLLLPSPSPLIYPSTFNIKAMPFYKKPQYTTKPTENPVMALTQPAMKGH